MIATSTPVTPVYKPGSTTQYTGGSMYRVEAYQPIYVAIWFNTSLFIRDDDYISTKHEYFLLAWLHGRVMEIRMTHKTKFRVIRQPKPRSNFKAWRYKR